MYVLITDWKDHWDRVRNGRTSYANGMIHVSSPIDGVPTLFIKIDETQRIQKAWHGHVDGIARGAEKTFFKVHLVREALPDQWGSFEGWRSGWYEAKQAGSGSAATVPPSNARLCPPFFDELASTTDYREFEDLCFKLLRVVGIHRVHRFPPESQAGRPDGFFRVGNLAVIYDSTLSSDFEEPKGQQIQNYCNLLLQGTVSIPPNITEHVGPNQKQVWVVTRGQSRALKTVGGLSSIVVKEVAVVDLKRIYVERLVSPMTEEDLENELRDIGSLRAP